MENNKGFTLVELLVSFAIFGIVLAAVFGFMISGTKSYTNVNGKIELETSSQLTMSFISEYLIDCDEALYYQDTNGIRTLYVINKATSEYSTLYIFKFSNADKSIYFSQGKANKNPDGSYSYDSLGVSTPELLTNLIKPEPSTNPTKSFTVECKTAESDKGPTVTSVKLTIQFENYSSQFCSSKTIALRNSPNFAIVLPK